MFSSVKHIIRKRDGAFTLIEVLVATTILAGGIIGVVGAFSLSDRAASRACRLRGAAEVAQRVLASAVAANAEKLQPASGSSGRFAWKLIYSDKPHDLMLASVSVTWLDRGRTETFELSRIFLPQQ